MHKLDCVRYATTRLHPALDSDGADIRATHDIARCLVSALWASINSVMLRPLSAYGARLRRVCFLDLDTGRELVVQQVDNLAIASRRNGLSVLPSHLLACVVERLADIGFGVREGVSNLASRLVAKISNLVLGMHQDAVFGPLKPLVPSRSLHLLGLLRYDLGKLLVSELDRRLDLPATDRDCLLAIGSRHHGVDAQINSDRRANGANLIRNLADDLDLAVVESDLHHSSRQNHCLGDADREIAGLATRQDHATVAKAGRLVREKHLTIQGLAVWIAARIALLAKRFSRRDRLAEIRDNLLSRLGVQAREKTFDLLLKIGFARPLASLLAHVGMSLYQPRPKTGSLFSDSGESRPVLSGRRKPSKLYSAITHERMVRTFDRCVNRPKPVGTS